MIMSMQLQSVKMPPLWYRKGLVIVMMKFSSNFSFQALIFEYNSVCHFLYLPGSHLGDYEHEIESCEKTPSLASEGLHDYDDEYSSCFPFRALLFWFFPC